MKRIDINICTRDRATEVYGLLVSLMHQTHNLFDVYVLDDGSGTPLHQFHFFNTVCNGLRHQGHRVHFIRNDMSKGVSKAREQLQEYTLKNGRGDFICRLDDDTVLDHNYLDYLLDVIDAGYDIASGVTPPLANPVCGRETKFVSPVINRIVLDEKGSFVINADDCGSLYTEEVILPADHFRSNCLYKKEIGVKVHYDDCVSKESGFREETYFSLRAIKAGYFIGVHTGAIAWHILAPSGGERRPEFGKYALINQQLLNRMVKRWFVEGGDFIKKYHDELESRGLKLRDTATSERVTLYKNNNLIYSVED